MSRYFLPFLLLSTWVVQPLRSQPAGVTSKVVGSCLVINLRGSDFSGPAIDACKKSNSSFRAGDLYQWVFPQLGYAFDQAERAQCGNLGCLGSRSVTLVIFPDSLANAAVLRTSDGLTLFMNTGLIDFVDAMARSLNQDLKDIQNHVNPSNGFADWMMSMVRAGGGQCGFHVKFPTPTVAQEDMTREESLASAAYQVVFAHELSHYLTPQFHCNYSGSDPLSLEMSCDKIAEDKLLRVGGTTFVPISVVAWMMSMESYERLTGPLYHDFYMTHDAPSTFEAMFPARDWKVRAEQVVREWRGFCSSGASSLLCPSGYEDAIGFADNMTRWNLPNACLEDGTTQAQASGDSCASLKQAISLSSTGFNSIKGERRSNSSWRSNLLIPGFSRCSVQQVDKDSSHDLYCLSTEGQMSEVESSFKSCLAGWKERIHLDSDGIRHATFTHQGSSTEVELWQPEGEGVSLTVEDD
jgi:hypothetical protein